MATTSATELVLVTGGSGFVGSHTALLALKQGYRVRTTVRSLKRGDEVRQMLLNGGATQEQVDDVEFIAADLSKDEGWTEACKDCKYVLHVASPFPAQMPKSEDELIIPAREGTLRVLRAAKAAGTVKRVVVTSSLAAVGYGHPPRSEPFTEKDWSVLESPTIPPYQKSKLIAERAAWDYIEKEGAGLELSVINPVGILGPILGPSAGTSVGIVLQMLQGKLPLLPKLIASWVDVRDVAELHLKAMVDEKANGQRYLASAGSASLKEIALILKSKLGADAKKVPTGELPNFAVKLLAHVDKRLALVADEIDKPKRTNNEKARNAFNWTPISIEEATVTAAQSCIKYGLVK